MRFIFLLPAPVVQDVLTPASCLKRAATLLTFAYIDPTFNVL